MPTTYPQLARETACTPDAVSSYSLHERRRDQAAGEGDPLEAEPRTYPHHSRRNDLGVRLLRGGRAGGEDVGWIGARDPQIVGFLVAPPFPPACPTRCGRSTRPRGLFQGA